MINFSFETQNAVNSASLYAIFVGQKSYRVGIRAITLSDFLSLNTGYAQFPFVPPFFGTISHIIRICSNKEMFWIYAWRVVALVANQKIFWNRANEKLIRGPMRFLHGFLVKPKCSVIGFISISSPNPACVRFFYVGHELFFGVLNRVYKKMVYVYAESIFARVVDGNATFDLTMDYRISKSMRFNYLIFYLYVSKIIVVFRACKNNAIAHRFNAIKKLCFEFFHDNQLLYLGGFV